MVKIDVDKVIGTEESYYSFVLGVAKRAREITDEQLKRVKEVIDIEKGKNNVLDRVKQLPEELSMKPVRLAVEEFKAGLCHLDIERPEDVLQREAEQELAEKADWVDQIVDNLPEEEAEEPGKEDIQDF